MLHLLGVGASILESWCSHLVGLVPHIFGVGASLIFSRVGAPHLVGLVPHTFGSWCSHLDRVGALSPEVGASTLCRVGALPRELVLSSLELVLHSFIFALIYISGSIGSTHIMCYVVSCVFVLVV